jgi:hypothetical protein
MRWSKILTITVICIVGVKAAWALAYPTSELRFRLTVNVETPLGLRSGSSVMKTSYTRQPGWLNLGRAIGYAALEGEAVFVDLESTAGGKSSNLIALLAWGPRGHGPDFADIPRRAFFDYLDANWRTRIENLSTNPKDQGWASNCEDGNDSYCELAQLPVGAMREVRGELIPTLITLMKLDDPKSVKVVRPDALEETFGLGFRLRDVTLEFVKPSSWPFSLFGMGGESLTHEIEVKLPSIFEFFRNQPQSDYHIEKAGDPLVLRRSQLKTDG